MRRSDAEGSRRAGGNRLRPGGLNREDVIRYHLWVHFRWSLCRSGCENTGTRFLHARGAPQPARRQLSVKALPRPEIQTRAPVSRPATAACLGVCVPPASPPRIQHHADDLHTSFSRVEPTARRSLGAHAIGRWGGGAVIPVTPHRRGRTHCARVVAAWFHRYRRGRRAQWSNHCSLFS